RPGGKFPEAARAHGMSSVAALLDEIVESESNHGPQLATMAGYILNRAAGQDICKDLGDHTAVEAKLREYSDQLLGSLPGYQSETSLTTQARKAIAVFERRNETDRESTFRNIGSALALEIISNRQLIPGEKHCLVDSGLYGATLDDESMHYLKEHWGEIGAEQQHEKNAIQAVNNVLNEETGPFIMEGAREFLDSLASLWDLLDSALLQSGHTRRAYGVTRAQSSASASA
ncbi:MAG TPA: hypothetical protein VJR89_12435, partial [Polyangiales bacterium]|nr:hypothetical protein [Polyangiales bacterium]